MSDERLGSTLFFAALVHGVVILGVTFTAAPAGDGTAIPSLNVTLVVDTEREELAADTAELMAKDETRERATLSLPILREGFEANVLREHDAAELAGMLQQFGVVAFGPAIFNGGQHIEATTSQLIRDRLRYMNVHVERHGQLEKPPSLQPDEER